MIFAWILAATVLTADTPSTTVEGNTFIAPAGWKIDVRGPATILESPEGDSHIALVDVHAKDADAAVAAAWAAYNPDAKWPLKITNDFPDRDGWANIRDYAYITSPNEKRDVFVETRRAGETWTVIVFDMNQAVEEKRGGQVQLIFSRLLPKGYQRESFAGKKANTLDAVRIAQLTAFVEEARKKTKVPGVSIGIIQDGKVVYAGGFGVRDMRRSAKADADTLYLIASDTKALTTLMLAKLVDEGKIKWDQPITTLLPSFRLGTEDTTKRVLVKHLVCACTGLPRQDFEWLFQYQGVTPEGAMKTLATVQPTSNFGEMFQYSNLLAGAGGFVGAHLLYPDLELGAAYDKAMQTKVFKPLGMRSTTFDFKQALSSNHATAHGVDIDGNASYAVMDMNYSITALRPAGGGWSNVHDLLKYIQMELSEGKLPDGTRYIGRDALLERRAPQVSIGKDATYGMGLVVNTKYEIPVVSHGGHMIGYHSNMMFLPQQNIGAVILTNSESGFNLIGPFKRKLLELLFDGHPEADGDVAAGTKSFFEQLAADRKLLIAPAEPADSKKLAEHYSNAALGDITVRHQDNATLFDFGEWKSEVASRLNPDGSLSFITISPGGNGFEFVVGGGGDKRSLTLRDAQHEYVFAER